MPIATSSTSHYPLSAVSRARRRRILWQMQNDEFFFEEENFPELESQTVLTKEDCIYFDSDAIHNGIDLTESDSSTRIHFPELDELLAEFGMEPVNPVRPDNSLDDSQVLSLSDSSSFNLKKSASFQPIRDLIKSEAEATWLFAGDSVTQGAGFTKGRRTYSEHFSDQIQTGLNRSNDIIINTAVVGETSRFLINRLEERILQFQPDVVSLMIGTDDCESGPQGRTNFRKNLERIIEQIRESGSLLFLHTPPFFDATDHKAHSDIRAYVRIVREVAREYWIPCMDHWNLWKIELDQGRYQNSWLASNGVHPSAKGHRQIAKRLFYRLHMIEKKSEDSGESIAEIR